jgi:hypothetical protein
MKLLSESVPPALIDGPNMTFRNKFRQEAVFTSSSVFENGPNGKALHKFTLPFQFLAIKFLSDVCN